jgi:hypothetical protein
MSINANLQTHPNIELAGTSTFLETGIPLQLDGAHVQPKPDD